MQSLNGSGSEFDSEFHLCFCFWIAADYALFLHRLGLNIHVEIKIKIKMEMNDSIILVMVANVFSALLFFLFEFYQLRAYFKTKNSIERSIYFCATIKLI